MTIVLLFLVVWTVLIPLLVVGLRLRRAALAEALAAPALQSLPRACEGRHRSAWTSRPRRRSAGLR